MLNTFNALLQRFSKTLNRFLDNIAAGKPSSPLQIKGRIAVLPLIIPIAIRYFRQTMTEIAIKDRKLKVSYLLWLIFTSIICVIILTSQRNHSVSINYWLAAHHWLQGEPLYDNSGRGFIYLPQSAILYIPLAILPFPLSEIIWRILSLGVFSYGLFCFSALVIENNVAKKINTSLCFLLMTVITIPIAFSSARNGQMHLFMTGILMLASMHLSKGNWLKVTTLLLFAFALKPTAIVLLLLVAGLFAETRKYLLIGLIFFLLFGFLTQSPHYVISQYMASISSMQETVRLGTKENWAQLFSLITQFGGHIPADIQTVIRLMVALATFILGYYIKKRCSLTQTTLWIFTLSMCYLMLFNPRTEGNDYIMLAPAIGFILINTLLKNQFYLVGFLVLLIIGLSSSYYIGKTITPENATWIDPFLTLLFSFTTIFSVFKSRKLSSEKLHFS